VLGRTRAEEKSRDHARTVGVSPGGFALSKPRPTSHSTDSDSDLLEENHDPLSRLSAERTIDACRRCKTTRCPSIVREPHRR